jgi:chromosomal replication initiator protein
MEFTADELWSRVLEATRDRLQGQAYRTWLASTTAVGVTDSEILIEVPSQFHVEWIGDRYGPLLTEVIQQILGRPLTLTLRCADPAAAAPIPAIEVTPQTPGASQPEMAAAPGGPGPALNQRYAFERFVVGNNNQLASAACHAVAAQPALTYNPLFLYGGVGLGKTHLMHAIGNAVLEADPTMRVAYVPTEQFTNDLVMAIQQGTTAEFRRRYRQMDLLLVDDIQFLKGKERTQEEFFHTFNALYDARNQIVLTSDRPPKEIPGLEERLISRFEWGLVADIKAPDFETRVAILRKKADDDGLMVSHDVMDFIAQFCTSSVRELEGAIIKLLAYSSITNQEISVELARKALHGSFGSSLGSTGSVVGAEHIRRAVATRWQVREEALSSKRRTRDLTVPRQVAMYLIRDILDYSLVHIGHLFGDRDHSTVIHSIRKVEDAMSADAEFRQTVEGVRAEIGRGP